MPVAPDRIQAQVGLAQGGFHSQVGIRIGRNTFGEDFFSALAGSFGTGNINFFNVFRRICQDGDDVRLDFGNPTGNGERSLLRPWSAP